MELDTKIEFDDVEEDDGCWFCGEVGCLANQ